MEPNKRVIDFINKFSEKHPKVIRDLFGYGFCYYFAIVLQEFCKVANIQSEIMYIPIYNHFCCKIDDNLYDIRGVITNKAMIQLADSWEGYFKDYDTLESSRIIRDCILKDFPKEE